MSQNNMAPCLVINLVPNLAKGFHSLFSRNQRRLLQKATSTISSSIGGGIGSLCFLRLSR